MSDKLLLGPIRPVFLVNILFPSAGPVSDFELCLDTFFKFSCIDFELDVFQHFVMSDLIVNILASLWSLLAFLFSLFGSLSYAVRFGFVAIVITGLFVSMMVMCQRWALFFVSLVCFDSMFVHLLSVNVCLPPHVVLSYYSLSLSSLSLSLSLSLSHSLFLFLLIPSPLSRCFSRMLLDIVFHTVSLELIIGLRGHQIVHSDAYFFCHLLHTSLMFWC